MYFCRVDSVATKVVVTVNFDAGGIVLSLSLGEVFVKGRYRQAGDRSPSVDQYQDLDPHPSTTSCWFSVTGPMFRKEDEQYLEKVLIGAIESKQMDITKLQIFPGALVRDSLRPNGENPEALQWQGEQRVLRSRVS